MKIVFTVHDATQAVHVGGTTESISSIVKIENDQLPHSVKQYLEYKGKNNNYLSLSLSIMEDCLLPDEVPQECKVTTANDNWINQMQKCLKNCPPGHWLFAADNGLYLMKYGPDGKRSLLPDGSMDQRNIVVKMTGPEIDGGDW